jgi:predicted RNase H-like HicB family nuclease
MVKGIVVLYHRESDGWWAESPDAPGFTAVAPTMEELEKRVEEGLRFHFEHADTFTSKSGASVNSTVEVLVGA